jgi:hypothetical protein
MAALTRRFHQRQLLLIPDLRLNVEKSAIMVNFRIRLLKAASMAINVFSAAAMLNSRYSASISIIFFRIKVQFQPFAFSCYISRAINATSMLTSWVL